MSEKREKTNVYVFEVHPTANKVQIRNAVEKLFDVKVLAVNTAIVHGKKRRHRTATVQRPDWKKAYVKVEQGKKIELY